MSQKLTSDLNYILQHTSTVWHELKDARIFITGGTGFFGTWLLETLLWANRTLDLNLLVTVLTRDPKTFSKKAPHLMNDTALQFLQGDVRNFEFPVGHFSHVIHAATEASAALNQENPQLMIDTILQGTQRTLECAAVVNAKKFLFLSSGAVYGKQPSDIECVEESYSGTPDESNAYAVGKYRAEKLCIAHAKQHGYEMKLARCFAFVGPHLPLDIHFAIGNFIRDGLANKTITVNGDGAPYRSYLYTSDLMIWLLRILCDGEDGVVYNVGSDEGFTIADIARLVASCFTPVREVSVARLPEPGQPPQRYVPSVSKAVKQFQLPEKISLIEAIKKTIQWYG